jgi:hypothetical protein
MIDSLDNALLLTIWEQASQLAPAPRSFHLVAAAVPPPNDPCELSLGEQDRRLFALRQALFGDRIEGLTECPSCVVQVEIDFQLPELTSAIPTAIAVAPLCTGEYEVRWRLPTCGDLLDLFDRGLTSSAREGLIERCLLEVRHQQRPIDPADCPENIVNEICSAMSQADPFAEIRLVIYCPECHACWEVPFDIGAFLWREIDVWASQILREIHCLATVYGWSEPEILGLSTQRRRTYLELVSA